jgi:hypothetical protein
VRESGDTSNLQKPTPFPGVPYARIYCFPPHRYLPSQGDLPQATSQTCFQHKFLRDAVLLLLLLLVIVVVVVVMLM